MSCRPRWLTKMWQPQLYLCKLQLWKYLYLYRLQLNLLYAKIKATPETEWLFVSLHFGIRSQPWWPWTKVV